MGKYKIVIKEDGFRDILDVEVANLDETVGEKLVSEVLQTLTEATTNLQRKEG